MENDEFNDFLAQLYCIVIDNGYSEEVYNVLEKYLETSKDKEKIISRDRDKILASFLQWLNYLEYAAVSNYVIFLAEIEELQELLVILRENHEEQRENPLMEHIEDALVDDGENLTQREQHIFSLVTGMLSSERYRYFSIEDIVRKSIKAMNDIQTS